MKLCIFTEPEKAEPVLFLKLENFLGDVTLGVCDASGITIAGCNILKITDNGTLTRYSHVNKELGFQLDGEGRIKLAEE